MIVWVKIDCMFGPGHQGATQRYELFDDEGLEHTVHSYIEDEFFDYSNLSIKWEQVDRPPHDVLKGKIVKAERSIEKLKVEVAALRAYLQDVE